MHPVVSLARRFLETRADWKSNLLPDGDLSRAEKAEVAARALAWVLGIDLDLMETPKGLPSARRLRGEMTSEGRVGREMRAPLGAAGPVTLVSVDLAQPGQDECGGPAAPECRWYLLDARRRIHADGARTELWSEFLSGQQVDELCEALSHHGLPHCASNCAIPADAAVADVVGDAQ